MKRKLGIAVMLIWILAIALSGCGGFGTGVEEDAENQITLHIQLNLKEDIGLLVVDYNTATSKGGSGGASNANQSLLKHDELIIYTLDREFFDNADDMSSLSLRFTIITDYFPPNYENIYPEEYTKILEPIDLNAAFGETYNITITGDNQNGYTAVLDN